MKAEEIRTICIIPARGGSKRTPRKNVKLLSGLPLISYTIHAAVNANVFTKIIVSTDDSEIKEIALKEGVFVDDRPHSMSLDTTTMLQVVKEYIERTNIHETFDCVAVLLPTCPFRTSDDVVSAYNMFMKNEKNDFLVGVTEYEFPIQLALKDIGNDSVVINHEDGYKTTRSQDIDKMYHPNGAIYMATINAFQKKGTFFNEEMLAYKMPLLRSFDIDYPYQFELAEQLNKLQETFPEIFQ